MNTFIAVILAAIYAIGLTTEAARGTSQRPMVTQQTAGSGAFFALAMDAMLAWLLYSYREFPVPLVVGLLATNLFVSTVRMSLNVGKTPRGWSPRRLVAELTVNAAELVGAAYLITVTL